MGVRRGGKRSICLPEIGPKNQKFLENPKSAGSSLIPISWLNSCNDTLFAGMTLPLRKSQSCCSAIRHWWTCMSLNPFLWLQGQAAKINSGLFYRWSLLRNRERHLQRFSSNYGSRRFPACDCWTQTCLTVNAARQWLPIAVSHVVLYCVKHEAQFLYCCCNIGIIFVV